jgi:hypothetical protein
LAGSLSEQGLANTVGKVLGPLCCLTNLQRLILQVDVGVASLDEQQRLLVGPCIMNMLGRLPHLSQLSLNIAAVTTASLQHLPVGVQELTLLCCLHRDEKQPTLQLRHLSGLSSLDMHMSLTGHEFQLRAGDELPLQLQQLAVDTVQQPEPLLQLQQLCSLEMRACHLKALELQRLTALASLTALTLSHAVDAADSGYFDDHAWTPGSSGACIWQQLPLMALNLCSGDVVGPQAVRALGLATHLTHLHISFCTVRATEQQLAEQLGKLQSLKRLWLDELELQLPQHEGVQVLAGQHDASELSEDSTHSEELQGMQDLSLQTAVSAAPFGCQLLKAVAQLPALRSLSVWGYWWSAAGLLELKAATQLTRLAITQHSAEDGVTDAVLVSLLGSLTGLQDLELQLPLLTEACLPVLDGLKHLTAISIEALRPGSVVNSTVKYDRLVHYNSAA